MNSIGRMPSKLIQRYFWLIIALLGSITVIVIMYFISFEEFAGVVAGIASAVTAAVLTAYLTYRNQIKRDIAQKRLKILSWLRWLELYLNEVKKLELELYLDKLKKLELYLDEEKNDLTKAELSKITKGESAEKLLMDKLPWWADHAMQSCGDSLSVLSKEERDHFIKLLKDTFVRVGMIDSEIASPIYQETIELLTNLEKKWKKTIEEYSQEWRF